MKCALVTSIAFVLALGIPASGQGAMDAAHHVDSASPATDTSVSSAHPQLLDRYPRYKLRKGDSFDINFTLSPEFNQTVAIEPDGYISLKDAGSIHVEGQTLPEVADTVRKAYANILHNPIISLTLRDFERPYFIVAGEVGKPGKYDLRSDLTVTQAIAVAGGFDERSKHSQVLLFRPVPGAGYETKVINVKRLLASRNLSEDIHIEPGDTLYVPQNTISKIRPYLPSEGMGAYYNPGMY